MAVYVFWHYLCRDVPERQERIDVENMVREAAGQRGYMIAGIRCGIHATEQSGIYSYQRQPCEMHITANFSYRNYEDWYCEWEETCVPAYIYTNGKQITRVEFFDPKPNNSSQDQDSTQQEIAAPDK